MECPLCCKGTFDTHNALKQHIQMSLQNLVCPSCKISCKLVDLPKHLEFECVNNKKLQGTKQQKPQLEYGENDGFMVDKEGLVEVKIESVNEDITDENTTTELGDYSTIRDVPGTVYSCEMCDMTFDSVEEHLAQYHEGEEVLLESVGDEEQDAQNQKAYLPEDDMFDEPNIYQEEDSLRSEITGPKEQNDQAALITKYLLENGRLRKLAPKEVEGITDKSKIIAIYSCLHCKLQFPIEEHFEKHNCDRILLESRKMFKRLSTDKKEDQVRYQCSFCSSTYMTLPELQEHMKVHLTADDSGTSQPKTITMSIHVCSICETKFPTYKQLKLHSKMHEPKTREATALVVDVKDKFQCKVCNRMYEKKYKEVHMKSHENDSNQFICVVCNKTLDSRENLIFHSKAHSSAKKFTCSYCKKTFISYTSLEKHINTECQTRDFACSYCGRRFSRVHEKVKHERIHTGEKPHVCDICGKAFRVRYCLTLHMRTHTGARPYTCHLCGKQFKSHSVCNHHLKTHSDDRNYKCPFCPKTFKTAVQLAGHKNCHTKPFSCTECHRPFSSLYAIKAHMLSHKKENTLKYTCSICGAEYGRSYALKEHLVAFHGYNAEKEAKERSRKQMEETENVEESSEIMEIDEDEPLPQELGEREVVQIFGEYEEGYVVHIPEDTNGTTEDNHLKAVEAL